MKQMRYVLSLGSNLGNRSKFINSAINFLSMTGTLTARSSLYETTPVGMKANTRSFYNCIVVLESDIETEGMLKKIKQFEKSIGRGPANSHMKPRQIDIDILFVDEIITNTFSLTIPHPEIGNRKFILEPLNEIIPDFTHPVSGKTIKTLLEKLNSDENVRLIKTS